MQRHVDLNRRFLQMADDIDPEELARRSYSSEEYGMGWDEVLKHRLIVILGEAGSGKSWEVIEQRRRLCVAGHTAFVVPIENLLSENIRAAWNPDDVARFERWETGEDHATFFLDALDDAKLRDRAAIDRALARFADFLAPRAGRVQIIITCRVSEWRPVSDVQALRQRFNAYLTKTERCYSQWSQDDPLEPEFLIVQIAGLDRDRVIKLVRASNIVDEAAFLAEMDRAAAWPFARRPKDVDSVILLYLEQGRLGSATELMESDIRMKLRDTNGRTEGIPYDRARRGAAFLAAASVMGRHVSFIVPDPQATLDLSIGAIDPRLCLPGDWTLEDIRELFQRPLFDEATYGRVRFHHRDIAEFLAAEWFSTLKHCTAGAVESQLWSCLHGRDVLRRSRAPVAAWLAGGCETWHRRLRRRLIKTAPDALLRHGDPGRLDSEERKNLLISLVYHYGMRVQVRLHATPQRLLALADPVVAVWIANHLSDKAICADLRCLFASIAEKGRLRLCSHSLLAVATDCTEPPYLRASAVSALAAVGDRDQLHELAQTFLQDTALPSELIQSACITLYPNTLKTSQLVALARRRGPIQHHEKEAAAQAIGSHLAETLKCNPLSRLITLLVALARRDARYHYQLPKMRGYTHWAPTALGAVLRRLAETGVPATLRHQVATIIADNANCATQLYDYRYDSSIMAGLRGDRVMWNIYVNELLTQGSETSSATNTLIDRTLARLRHEDLPVIIDIANQHEADNVRQWAILVAWNLVRRRGGINLGFQRQLQAMAEREKMLDRVPELRAIPFWKHLQSVLRFWLVNIQIRGSRGLDRQIHRWCTRMATWLQRNNIRQGSALSFIEVILNLNSPLNYKDLFTNHHREWATEGARKHWRRARVTDDDNDGHISRAIAVAGITADLDTGMRWDIQPAMDVSTAAWCALNLDRWIPNWIENLASTHPKIVAAVARERFDSVWATDGNWEPLLERGWDQYPSLIHAVAPEICDKLNVNDPDHFANLEDTLIILSVIGGNGYDLIAELAPARIILYKPEVRGSWFSWFTAWLGADADAALSYLEQVCSQNLISIREVLSSLSASLQRIDCLPLWGGNPSVFAAEHLGSVIRLCCLSLTEVETGEVLIASDSDRIARRLRWLRGLLLSLLESGSDPHGYAIFMKLLEDRRLTPHRWLIEEYRDRHLADMGDSSIWKPEFVPLFAERYEVEPQTADELYNAVLQRLREIRSEVETQELSRRTELRAGDPEFNLQVWLTRLLNEKARGAYDALREAQFDTGERPDIWVSRPKLPRVHIEVKWADKPYTELLNGLRQQLVERYLLNDGGRHGIYIVASYKDKKWRQENNEANFSDIVEKLRQEAALLLERNWEKIDRIEIVGINFLK